MNKQRLRRSKVGSERGKILTACPERGRNMKSIEERIKELPPEPRKEVQDFVDHLLAKRKRKSKGKLKLDWAGALKDLRDKYTSVELQHKISEWRIGER